MPLLLAGDLFLTPGPLSPHQNDFQEYHLNAKQFGSRSGPTNVRPGRQVIKLFSCSTQLSITFIMLINVKMPTIVGI